MEYSCNVRARYSAFVQRSWNTSMLTKNTETKAEQQSSTKGINIATWEVHSSFSNIFSVCGSYIWLKIIEDYAKLR